jgi:hypothetical protein
MPVDNWKLNQVVPQATVAVCGHQRCKRSSMNVMTLLIWGTYPFVSYLKIESEAICILIEKSRIFICSFA